MIPTLADLLDFIVSTLQVSPLCQVVRVIRTDQFSDTQYGLKVRADLKAGGFLQVRLYRNGDRVDYSYQLVRGDKPVLRWDNKEHFPQIATHPHHFHGPAGKAEESALGGDPATICWSSSISSPNSPCKSRKGTPRSP